jgi:hypothetical protein
MRHKENNNWTELFCLDHTDLTQLSDKILTNKLNENLQWKTYDFSNINDCQLISDFIQNNNKESTFLKKTDIIFLQWFFLNSDYLCLGIELIQNSTIIALICGKVIKINNRKDIFDTIRINFLNVCKDFRNENITTHLVYKLHNHFKLKGYNTSFFATNILSQNLKDKQICKIINYYRPINLTKLIQTKYITNIQDSQKIIDYYQIDEQINENITIMKEEHLDQVFYLLQNYLKKYVIYQIFSFDEFKYTFLNNNIVSSFVYLKNNRVLDFFSYYKTNIEFQDKNNLHSHTSLNIGHLYLYTSTQQTVYQIIKDSLVCAKLSNIDLFCAFDVMEHSTVLNDFDFYKKERKITIDDSLKYIDLHNNDDTLYYFLYGTKYNKLLNTQIGLFL